MDTAAREAIDPASLRGKRVLLTGGAGFIGSHLVDRLVGSGARVTVMDDLSTGSREHVNPAAELILADVAAPSVIGQIERAAPEIVIHAAAQVSVPASVADVARDRMVNLVGTEHVLVGARKCSAERFVFISSGGAIYGEADGARETDVPRPESPYGIHKLAAEGYVRTSGLSYAIARYANVYGPRQRSHLEGGVVAIFAERLTDGLPITLHGTGEQARDFIYVDDVVEATLALGLDGRPGTWNVATGVSTTIRSLLDTMAALIGPPVSVESAPRRDGDVLVSRLSADLIADELGWRHRFSLEDGLRRLMAFAA